MVEYDELMQILSVPRPNGSAAERETSQRLQAWLRQHDIPYHVQVFRSYPYFFESIGIWLVLSRLALALAVWMRWTWAAAILALLGLVGGVFDVLLHLPIVSWSGASHAENLLMEIPPQQAPAQQEVIISAHYDSKTEPLDHRRRMFFLLNLPAGIVLTGLLGLLSLISQWLADAGSPWSIFVYGMAVALSLPMLFLALGLGLNLSLGRLMPPSTGAIDNGAACAILLGLALHCKEQNQGLKQTAITLALFTGEEANMQGSRAYIKQREWNLPAAAINLEVMAQDGPYVYWQQDGSVFGLLPTSEQLNTVLRQAVLAVTGSEPIPAGPVTSDGGSFLQAGLPAADLGTYHSQYVDTGFHSPSDNLQRLSKSRLEEAVEILIHCLTIIDQEDHNPVITRNQEQSNA